MARLRRYCPAGLPVHIIQRGNNRSDCFRSSEDRAVYMKRLRDAANENRVDVHAWVLMTNHVHLLVTPNRDQAASKMMQSIGRDYVRYFNRKYTRSGTLWEGRFRSCLIQQETYFLLCQRYIELNPVRAGMVEHPRDFQWSSYRTNALGTSSSIATRHPIYLSLGAGRDGRQTAYRALFQDVIDSDQLASIRHATNKGLIFGSETFKDRIESQSRQRARLGKRGPKIKSAQ